MMFPHEKREAQTHGRSPGNGITPMVLSRDPLATEGEATSGPDTQNPYDDPVVDTRVRDPSRDPDPFVFDDVGPAVEDVELPFFKNDTGGPMF